MVSINQRPSRFHNTDCESSQWEATRKRERLEFQTRRNILQPVFLCLFVSSELWHRPTVVAHCRTRGGTVSQSYENVQSGSGSLSPLIVLGVASVKFSKIWDWYDIVPSGGTMSRGTRQCATGCDIVPLGGTMTSGPRSRNHFCWYFQFLTSIIDLKFVSKGLLISTIHTVYVYIY